MKSLFYQYDMTVKSAYIIRLKDHIKSEQLAARCARSCESVKQPYVFWDAYDGTDIGIKTPIHHNAVMDIIKVTDNYLTRTEVATALSHISLWVECARLDSPIVILEHDAIMIQAYPRHNLLNSIAYLGCEEQFTDKLTITPTPVHAANGPNYHSIYKAHAYAIDPFVAKNLISHVIKHGICAPLDLMIRADLFPMHQMGLVAYDFESNRSNTTITGRADVSKRATIRNDDLSI